MSRTEDTTETDIARTPREPSRPYVADALTVVNMTKNNRAVVGQLEVAVAGLSQGVKDKLQHYVRPVHVETSFLNILNQRWSYRFPNLKDQNIIHRTARYYNTSDDRFFREMYVTCADYAIRCHQNEMHRLKKQVKVGRKPAEINNRKILFITQLLNILYVTLSEFKVSNNRQVLINDLRVLLEFCHGVIDQAESGNRLWRNRGEPVSFVGTLRQISHAMSKKLKNLEKPVLPSPVDATKALIKSLDQFAESSLVMSLSHMLSNPVPMNISYLLKKMHYVSQLAQAGSAMYEIVISKSHRRYIQRRCLRIEKKNEARRSYAEQRFLSLFSSVGSDSITYNAEQMIYMMLIEKKSAKLDTPSRNRSELEPLLSAFRSHDDNEQAMLFDLLLFVSCDVRDFSHHVYKVDNIPSEYREKSLRELGLAPLKGLPGVADSGDARDEADDTADSNQSTADQIKRMLQSLDQYLKQPVEQLFVPFSRFDSWVVSNKSVPIGIVRQLNERGDLSRVLYKYRDSLNDMLSQIKEVDKVIATLQVALKLFYNLSQADINSLSGVLMAVLQVVETALNRLCRSVKQLNRNTDDSYVSAIVRNTVHHGKRISMTAQWYDNLVRLNHYSTAAQVNKISSDINELKRALTRAPDDQLALRVGLFIRGVTSLFGVSIELPQRLLNMMQQHAIAEVADGDTIVGVPSKLLDEMKLLLRSIKQDDRKTAQSQQSEVAPSVQLAKFGIFTDSSSVRAKKGVVTEQVGAHFRAA